MLKTLHISRLDTASEFPSKIYRSENVTSRNIQTKFLKLLHLLHANHPHLQDEQGEVIKGKFYEKEFIRVI